MSHAKLTDAELAEAVRLVALHGTCEKAAEALGVPRSTLQARLNTARARGIVGTSPSDETAKLKTKVKLLEKELQSVQRANDSAESIRKRIYNIAAQTPDPPKWLAQERAAGSPGIPFLMCSDWHFGEDVRAEEVGGLNVFNTEIAKQRVKRLTDITVDLALKRLKSIKPRGIVCALGGDMVTGDIHEELTDTNDRYVLQSVQDVVEVTAAMLTVFADEFGKVFVPCVVGNHGRMSRKPRMKGRVYTNLEWNAYVQLERHFRGDPRIQFLIPGEADCRFTVLGHRFLLTHGDSLGVKGGDGIIGAIGPIARGTFKVGRSEAQIGRDFDTIVMGHWHIYIPRSEAFPGIVNGALKGYDEYARLQLRAPYSRPSQALWFVHETYGCIWQTPVYVDDVAAKPHTKGVVVWNE